MKKSLKYGNHQIDFELNKKEDLYEIHPNAKEALEPPAKTIREKLENPISSPSLAELLDKKDPDNVVIVVNDITRPTPHSQMLPPLLREIHSKGIKENQIIFLIATGAHKPHSKKQNREMLGSEITEKYKIISHNSDEGLVHAGDLSSGNKLYLNKIVSETDFLITTGVISPHYFAGFSGGRKSLLPGVGGRTTINNNHKLVVNMLENEIDASDLRNNPINKEMIEAANLTGIDFILNVVTDQNNEIANVVAGDWHKAWLDGVNLCREIYYVKIPRLADVTIASAGGFPRDINLYQAHKALEHSAKATKPGGTIILLAECKNGFGDETFENWIKSASTISDIKAKIKDEFVLGGHKAFAITDIIQKYDVILISSLSERETEEAFMKKEKGVADALKSAFQKKSSCCISIIDSAAEVVPYR